MAKQRKAEMTKADAIRATLAAGIVKPSEAAAHVKKTYGLDGEPTIGERL